MLRNFSSFVVAMSVAVCGVAGSAALASPTTDSVADAYLREFLAGNYSKAAELIKPYALNGDSNAQNWLAKLYLKGQGVARNMPEGVRLLRLSANAGNRESQYLLGSLLLQGDLIERDEMSAFAYLKAAAMQGQAEAQLRLGILLSEEVFEGDPGLPGELVDATAMTQAPPQAIERNAEQSAFWMQKAAAQGLPVAQYNLGLAYQNGQGVPLNMGEAVRLYRLAALQGQWGAQNNLGLMYASGGGVRANHVTAYAWFVLAASSKNFKSVENRDRERQNLSHAQAAFAEKIALRCQQSDYEDCALRE